MTNWGERMNAERARRIQASNDQAQKQSAALDAAHKESFLEHLVGLKSEMCLFS